MIRCGKIIRIGVALTLALAVAGCQFNDTTGSDKTSAIEAAEVRTDRKPIADRFPRLGSFVDAPWVGGSLGNVKVRGPSTSPTCTTLSSPAMQAWSD